MATLTIDGKEITVEDGMTLIQACEIAGAEIPRFCYHERLEIAGNCRMCLVEVQPGPPKPQASCALPVADGMTVTTNSPKVKKAREGVMEFLLINHPLDCPICDQGGECDLQDQAMAFGTGESRFKEGKRAVPEKNMGPLIKTQMTRCIHCTRCVRFTQDVAGVPELGAIHRGEHTEITTYLDQAVTNELSGNVIDLCPVGALTARPYAFKARSWELKHTESVDVLDAVGSNIRVDSRGREVIRILPRLNEAVNEEWISDKTRFACDGLRSQRLDRPMVRKDGRLEPVSWEEALQVVADKLKQTKADKIGAIVGDLVDAESIFALKGLMDALKVPNLDCRQDGAKLEADVRASYLFNTTIEGIEEADFCLLIGTNPRLEAPLVNARLRKRFRRGGFAVANIGPANELTYPVEQFSTDLSSLEELRSGKGPIAKALKDAKNPMIIVGMGALSRADGDKVLGAARDVADKFKLVRDDWNGFNVLHTAASRVAALDMGFVPAEKGKDVAQMIKATQNDGIELLYLLGADEIDTASIGDAFVVYQGHHGDAGAHRADVIFPGAAYTEKHGTYVNTEGRVQRGYLAVFPPGEAKEDWKIIRALSERVGKTLPFNSLRELRAAIEAKLPQFAEIDAIVPAKWGQFGASGAISGKALSPVVENFYMTDPVSRASKTMAECTRQAKARAAEMTEQKVAA